MLRLRCGNMKARNKYWLEDEETTCVFCGIGKDNIIHYVKDCVTTKDKLLGRNCEEIEDKIWNDKIDNTKGREL